MVGHIKNLENIQLNGDAVKDASIQVLVSPKDGWEGHVLRVLHVEEGGFTPKHSHPWYHVNYVLEGEGELLIGDTINKLTAGSYAYVPGDTLHQFRNVGKQTFSFICIVIEEGHKI